MEMVLALLGGAIIAGSVYLMLDKNLIRFIFGLVLASNAVNLLIFAAGRPRTSQPPLIPQGSSATTMANSLPQALILTAIVIGFALLVFVFILFFRAYDTLGTIDTDGLSDAECPESDRPPEGARHP